MPGAFWQCSGTLTGNASKYGVGFGAGGYLAEVSSPPAGLYIHEPGAISLVIVTVTANARAADLVVALAGHSGGEPVSVTIPAGATGPFLLDGVATVQAGDTIYPTVTVTGSEPSHFYTISAIGCQFTAFDPTQTVTRFHASDLGTTVGATQYYALVGQLTPQSGEVTTTFRPGAGTLRNASIFVVTNTRNADSALTLRSAGADTDIVIPLPVGVTGWLHDTTHLVIVDGSQAVNWRLDRGGTTGALTIVALQLDDITTDGSWTSGLGQAQRNPSVGSSIDLAIGGLNNVAGPQGLPFDTRIIRLGIYIQAGAMTTPGSLTWVTDGVASSLTVPIPAGFNGPIEITGRAAVLALNPCLIRLVSGATSGPIYFCIWFTGTSDFVELGEPGPLMWGHIRRVHPNGDVITENVSDTDMSCAADWYAGFKEALIKDAGQGERASSDLITGEWQGSTYRVTLADKARRYRQFFASAIDRFFTPAQSSDFYWTSRDNRAVKGVAFPIFNGPLISAKPVRPLGFELTFGDIIAATLLAEENKVPWRRAIDGIFAIITRDGTAAEHFDPETPEPIVLGEHLRLPTDPASEQGLIFPPVYLGIMDGNHWWMTAGHALAAYLAIYVSDGDTITDVSADSPSVWTVPGWHSEPKYLDYRSPTYGKMRRYSLVRGVVGDEDVEKCASGERKLLVAVQGWENTGVGTGAVIVDAVLQYMYWFINHVANYGINCQHTVPLTNPSWQTQDGPIPILDEHSFANCAAIWALRYPIGAPRPTGGTYPPGAIGAAVIGIRGGNADRDVVKRWVADFNRSVGGRLAFTARGRARLWMTHPTTDIKASALLFGDDLDILKDSFDADLRLPEMANRQPWRTDYNHLTGSTQTSGTASDDASVRDYRRDKTADVLDLPFTPGSTQGNLRAQMLVYQRANPTKPLVFDANVGPDRDDKSAAKLECGDYFRYFAHAAISNTPTEIRLAQVEKVRPLVGPRRVEIQAFDVEDLIGRFAYVPPSDITGSDGCASAEAIDAGLMDPPTSNRFERATTAAADDTSISALLAPYGVVAHNAAWFKGTPPNDGRLFVTTFSSRYDTFMAIFTGACGSLVFAKKDGGVDDAFNDNDGDLLTSVLDIPVIASTDYFVVVGAVNNDGGDLVLGAQFYIPAP